ncbi:coiled-coil-helix-coiled-coil-helix domain-containing protein 10, mitochondrial [Drosophila serrata]|uniref:coiled-coil-helix-coiled-coil-helix domain-containing protein 10, mitochondrial n=1 Tax=Drosophila serrata TaxID=7274 RepID=UPI000A1D22DA|nr:coiled-coil-helix-coiled-coil-helix domain-containing protein 10, mitochondrial [Drosophila serrata]
MSRRSKSCTPKYVRSNQPVTLVPLATKESLIQSASHFNEVATRSAGVAAGSTVGHVIGAGLTGFFRGNGHGNNSLHSDLVEDGPCAAEMRQFLKCIEENDDLNMCKEFNDAVRQCHKSYNI